MPLVDHEDSVLIVIDGQHGSTAITCRPTTAPEHARPWIAWVGFETDVCVAQSAIGLRERGMRVVVLEDTVYSPGEMHARGIARMTAEGVEINHCKGLAYEWTRTLDRSREILGADGLGDAPFRL